MRRCPSFTGMMVENKFTGSEVKDVDKDFRELTKMEQRGRHKEIFKVFSKLGFLAFGGPAAHLAMMDDEIIEKRKWITREKFMDLMGATNLIPGPNSTEMAIHLGYERGGVKGLFIAGVSFILPAMAMVLGLAYLYRAYGTLPKVEGILNGIKPVMIAIVFQALLRLSKTVFKGPIPFVLAVMVAVGSLFGINEILLLLIAGIIMMVIKNREEVFKVRTKAFYPFTMMGISLTLTEKAFKDISLTGLFLSFLKIGSVLYGSGYVLLAFLESEFVDKLGLITSSQLIDAVAIGQLTPGPVFTTATFVGYLILGVPGALVSTMGIFLPSFLLVWLMRPLIPRLRSSKLVAGALDGVNAASLGLMGAVTLKLAMASLSSPWYGLIFLASLFLLFKVKMNSALLIILGGITGFLLNFL